MKNEDLFFDLNITEDGYVIGRHNHDAADSVSVIGYTEESKHAQLFVSAPCLLSALQQLLEIYDDHSGKVWTTSSKRRALDNARAVVNKALGETK